MTMKEAALIKVSEEYLFFECPHCNGMAKWQRHEPEPSPPDSGDASAGEQEKQAGEENSSPPPVEPPKQDQTNAQILIQKIEQAENDDESGKAMVIWARPRLLNRHLLCNHR